MSQIHQKNEFSSQSARVPLSAGRWNRVRWLALAIAFVLFAAANSRAYGQLNVVCTIPDLGSMIIAGRNNPVSIGGPIYMPHTPLMA